VHQRLALGLGHLAEHIAGGIGEGGSEAQNLLTLRAGVKDNGVGCTLGTVLPCQRCGLSVALIAEGAPDLYLLRVRLEAFGRDST